MASLPLTGTAPLPAMAPPAVEVVGLGKRYGDAAGLRHGTLYDRLSGRAPPAPMPERWALRDVSFAVPKGQVLGIVGRNGSGKTTLMKVLSRITSPTEGRAVVRGRVGALLEIGSGFHPELTGRENVRLTAALLGMTPEEAAAALPGIIDFAEIGAQLDAPVKHYSIGMYMRLAFAVSAHLSAEILLLDEILAVGDERFQAKCRERILGLCRAGRTVLIISHVSAMLKEVCERLLVLEGGRLVYDGDPVAGVDHYHREILPYPGGAAQPEDTP